MEQWCILIVMVVAQIYAWDKVAQKYTHIHNWVYENWWSLHKFYGSPNAIFPVLNLVLMLYKTSALGEIGKRTSLYIGFMQLPVNVIISKFKIKENKLNYFYKRWNTQGRRLDGSFTFNFVHFYNWLKCIYHKNSDLRRKNS